MLIYRVGSIPGVGGIGLSASDRGIAAIRFHNWDDQPLVSHRDIGIVVGEHPIIDAAFAQISAFILGRRRDFNLACDFSGLTPTRRQVLEAARRIPWGRIRTYTQIAAELGLGPQAVRSVIESLCRNPLPLVIPCHRVVDTYDLGHFVGGPRIKRQLLQAEGIDTRALPDPREVAPTSSWIRRPQRVGA